MYARMDCEDAGVVLRHGSPAYGDENGARDVWVFEHAGEYFMHYDALSSRGWLAARATSRDGVTWRKEGTILELGGEGSPDGASASYATVFDDTEGFHVFYLGTPNATNDGLRTPAFPYMTLKARGAGPRGPWRKQPDVRPFLPEEGTWFSSTASPGQIIRTQEGFAMIFSASRVDADGAILRTLGVARTGDLDGTWTVDPEPLLPGTEQVENSSLYFEPANGLWFLFTNHVGSSTEHDPVPPQDTSEYTDAIWVYWSADPLRYSSADRAVVLDAANCTWSPRAIGLPSVLPIDGRLALYYDGCADDVISHGSRDIGLAWITLPLEPPRVSDA